MQSKSREEREDFIAKLVASKLVRKDTIRRVRETLNMLPSNSEETDRGKRISEHEFLHNIVDTWGDNPRACVVALAYFYMGTRDFLSGLTPWGLGNSNDWNEGLWAHIVEDTDSGEGYIIPLHPRVYELAKVYFEQQDTVESFPFRNISIPKSWGLTVDELIASGGEHANKRND